MHSTTHMIPIHCPVDHKEQPSDGQTPGTKRFQYDAKIHTLGIMMAQLLDLILVAEETGKRLLRQVPMRL